MVPAGDPTEQVVTDLAGLLSPGDVVIDGGNSNWHDSVRRAGELAERGVGFVDAGTSGGVWGRTEGYCLMVGGTPEHVATAQPIFDALKPEDGGFVHAGPVGTGHFTKMVHNGIEYGLMQAYAEGYELLARSDLGIDVDGALDAWRRARWCGRGCWTCWCGRCRRHPTSRASRLRQRLGRGPLDRAGGGRAGVATPVISAALYARFVSQHPDAIAMKAIAALRNQFGGHAVLPETEDPIGDQPVEPPAGGPSA